MPLTRLPSAFALSLLASLPSFAFAADSPAPEAARVEIALSDADGNTVEMVGQNLSWNQTHRLRESVDDHQYGVSIAMKRGEGDKLTIALSYERDGAMVVERHDVRAKLAEPVRLASKAGDAQVVFVVRAEPPRGKLDVGGSDDPLGGI
jgi:hypothetical protein